MEVNKRCNLRCQHCDFWQRDDDDRANYLSLDRKRDILTEYAAMNDNGHVVICGGEPMLDLDEYFGMAGACRDLGLRCLSVVNGTRIRSTEMAERMITQGPHEISISLNSHREDLHDRTRGVPGAFRKATNALRLLVAARRKLRAEDTRIYVMGLVYGENYREIEDFYDLVLNDIGADKLKLNFLQPAFGQSGETDPFFAAQSDVDPDELVAIIERCDKRFNLGINPTWLEQVGMYFRSLQAISDREKGWGSASGTTEHICNTYERNVMINHYGVARLCFSVGFPGKALEKAGDFRAFWETSNAIRARMRKCNQYCGISHSVRRESSTLKGRQKMTDHVERFGPMRPPGLVNEVMAGIRELVG
jgi:MoaA/NifB/PqqE/SkfB family radical SAM enzyme